MTFAVMGGGQVANTGFAALGSLRWTTPATGFEYSRVNASAGNRKTWTMSFWAKMTFGRSCRFYVGDSTVQSDESLRTTGSGTLQYFTNGGTDANISTLDAMYSSSGWYHIVLAVDTTQATSSNRVKIYVNNVLQSLSTATAMTLNYDTGVNTAGRFRLGSSGGDPSYFNLSEVYLIDGQQLTPTSFGTYNSYNNWVPKAYSGTYGTNGFYLNFKDRTSTTTLGYDYSGNGNHLVPYNGTPAITGGYTVASYDSPTSVNDSIANYPKFTHTSRSNSYSVIPETSGLSYGGATTQDAYVNWGMSTGKWYWEVAQTGPTSNAMLSGVSSNVDTTPVNSNTVSITTTSTFYGMRFDADVGTLEYTSNGTAWNNLQTGLTTGPYFPYLNVYAGHRGHINFGQYPFVFSQPSGYKKLNSFNTPYSIDPRLGYYAGTYTGTGGVSGSAQTITGMSFQPDLIIFLPRGGTGPYLTDSSRGGTNYFDNRTSNAQVADGNFVTSFNSNGFTMGISSTINNTGSSYEFCAFKKSPATGLDIRTWSGTGATNNIAHNLGVVPDMILVRNYTGGAALTGWFKGMTGNDYVNMGLGTSFAATDTTWWSSTTPTSSQFTVGTSTSTNASGSSYVAYIFANVPGVIKCGRYTGESTRVEVFCGFKPRTVLIRGVNTSGTLRQPVISNNLYTSSFVNDTKYFGSTGWAGNLVTFTATGFIVEVLTSVNSNAIDFCYAAFADQPRINIDGGF